MFDIGAIQSSYNIGAEQASGPTAVTITASKATVAITGKTATANLIFQLQIVADKATVPITGKTTTVRIILPVSADKAAAPITGKTATVALYPTLTVKASTPSKHYPNFSFLERNLTTAPTLGTGNLTLTTTADYSLTAATLPVIETGCYWEVEVDTAGDELIGLWAVDTTPLNSASTTTPHTDAASYLLDITGNMYYNGGSGSAFTFSTVSDGDVLQFAYKEGKLYLGINGTWENSANPDLESGEILAISGSHAFNIKFVAGRKGTSNVTYTARFESGSWTESNRPSWGVEISSNNLPVAPVATSPDTGSFKGNTNVDGPVVYLGYTPSINDTLTVNGNGATWGTHAQLLARGFKIITASTSYNDASVNSYSIVTTNATPNDGDKPPPTAQYNQ